MTLVFGGLQASLSAAPATQPADHAMTAPTPAKAKYLSLTDDELRAILGNPPADGSDEHRAETDKLLSLQSARSPADVQRCQAEEVVTVFAFADVLGKDFTAEKLPLTAALMNDVFVDARIASDRGKQLYRRTRPYVADSRVQPCAKKESSDSYPSGHATRGVAWAILLADAFPARREPLMERGKQIGSNRALAGLHWPTDVAAGQRLGEAFVARLMQNPTFKADWEKARAELKAALH